MFVSGYNFVPSAGYQPNVQAVDQSWQYAQAQGQAALPQVAAVPPPLPAEAPPPLPPADMQTAVQSVTQQGMQAWGQEAAQQAAVTWEQQQAPGVAPQQWQQQPMQQWPAPDQQDQQQQWQAQQQQQPWPGQQQQQWPGQQQQWPQEQQWPQQQQQQQQQPQPQQATPAAGSSDWRSLWAQQRAQQAQQQQQQQQQQQVQWGQGQGQGMGPQQWGQGGGMQQPYGGMYNQQPYSYNQQQGAMMQQGSMYNQFGPQAQMPQQPPPPAMPSAAQQAWSNPYPQQQQQQQQQQQPAQQVPPVPSPRGVPGSDYNMGGMGLPALQQPQQQQLQQPPVPPGPSPAAAAAAVAARPPSPPRPMDLSQLLLAPGRNSRPKRLLLLLRGPPGCGKSHVARTIRQMEVSAGGQAPRLHSIDDYFMTEVEQGTEEGASSGSKRRGAPVMVQEYQYDADLEPSYWKSLLRAAGKTLADGLHPLVLLDAPALRAEQVREVWKVVQGAGAELLVVNPLTTDPQVCFNQNSHKHSLDFIQQQAKLYEPAPATFTCADATSLFEEKKSETSPKKQGTKAGSSSSGGAPALADISEVDMAVEDAEEDVPATPAAAAAAADAGPAGSTPAAAAAGVGAGAARQARAKTSRWEDDSDDESAGGAQPAPGSSGSPGGQGGWREGGADQDSSAAAAAAAAWDRPKKKARFVDGLLLDTFDAESLLAGVNQELELLDAADGSAAATARDTAGRAGGGGGGGGGAAQSSGSSGGRVSGILKKAGTPNSRCKKVRVRWPDLSDQAEQQQQGFRIAAPVRPLAEVFWVEGLGPSKELWMPDADSSTPTALGGPAAAAGGVGPAVGPAVTLSRHSFADQVRAEHRAEHDIFRSILLGHSSTPPGPVAQPSQQAAGGAGSSSSSGAGGLQPRLFMQQKSV